MDMVGLVIEVVIFTALIGTIATSVVTGALNLTGAALILFSLITLIVIAGFITYLVKKMGIKSGK